jgi:nucleotide-binding universal stress UspA family protein
MAIANEYLVAGVDGSEASLDAARWAGAEAARRHCELRLLQAYSLPAMVGYPDYDPFPEELAPVLRDEAQKVTDRVAAELRRTYPQLTVTAAVVQQMATDALRDASHGAVLTVVGSDHVNRFHGVMLGSVALAVASTNPAPVAVIHRGQTQRTEGPVVVGVDGSRTSDAAVAFAFQAAAVRGADLIALHVWNDITVPVSHRMRDVMDPVRIEQEEQALLAQRTSGWTDKYPDVAVRRVVVEGRAVAALLEYSAAAQLLVVGSHGRGGFTGMLLGSTSHSLIIHGTCPVVVVRPHSAD